MSGRALRIARRVGGTAPLFVLLLALAGNATAFDTGARGPQRAVGSVEVAFSPWDDTEGLVLRTIRAAKHEIYVQAYVFTSRKLARALIEAKERGVAVEVLADGEMAVKGNRSRIPQLAQAGIPVRLEVRYDAAHNKVILIDPSLPENAVVTGSYNFTYAARARNAENVLVLRDNPALARAYYRNFLRHRDGAVPYRAAAQR